MRTYNVADRIEYIDVAKGILIVLVVLGHVTTFPHVLAYGMKAVITSFHMPAFFIISGMLTKVEKLQDISVKQFILKKSYRLLIPYVFFELVGGLQQILLMGTESVNIGGILYGIFTIHCHVGADWFLPTMFFAEIGLFFLIRECNRKYYPLFSATCFLVAFSLSDLNYFVACCRRILIAMSFIVIGLSFKKLFTGKNLYAGIISGLLTVAIAYMNGVVDLSARQFGNPMLYLLSSTIGTYFILCVSEYTFGIFSKVLGRLGRSSLTIMGTHQNVQVACNSVFGSVYHLQAQIVVYVTTIVCEVIIVILFERFVPFLVGIQQHTMTPSKHSKDN